MRMYGYLEYYVPKKMPLIAILNIVAAVPVVLQHLHEKKEQPTQTRSKYCVQCYTPYPEER
jgi:hypothetical protein